MPDAPPLSVAYIERNPRAASRVLENLDTADAAALIAVLPGRIAALALEGMTPLGAGQCLGELEAERAASLIRAMRFQDAASILRVTGEEARQAVIAALPEDLARDFGRSLGHSRDSVGAWMNRRLSPLAADMTVGDALKYARRKRRPEGNELFVVGEHRVYLGIVRISEIVQRDNKTLLQDVTHGEIPALSNRASLASVVNLPLWDEVGALAVTGRKGNLLGSLTRGQARAGLAAARRQPAGVKPNAMLSHLLNGYVVTAAGLAALAVQTSGAATPAADRENRHGR